MTLREIQAPVESLLKETDQIIREQIQSNLQIFNKIKSFIPLTEGKKIRSTLLFLLSGLNNSANPILPRLAATIELFHFSSLIHDDIIDNSILRRGRHTLNQSMGNAISVLGGDFLFMRAMDIIHRLSDHKLMDIILRTATQMVEGQLIEAENENNYQLSLDTYLEIVHKKTATMFEGVSEFITSINGIKGDFEKKYHHFGLNFGIIFQMSDDVLDIFSHTSGKDRFNDLKEGKITLPIILYLQQADSDIIRDFSPNNQNQLIERLEQLKIKESALNIIDQYYLHCQNFIQDFPNSVFKESLTALLNFVKSREF